MATTGRAPTVPKPHECALWGGAHAEEFVAGVCWRDSRIPDFGPLDEPIVTVNISAVWCNPTAEHLAGATR